MDTHTLADKQIVFLHTAFVIFLPSGRARLTVQNAIKANKQTNKQELLLLFLLH